MLLSFFFCSGVIAVFLVRTSCGSREQLQAKDGRALIVGGDVVTSGEYPFFGHAASGCGGGTLIHEDILLTSLRCNLTTINHFAVGSTIHIGGINYYGTDSIDTVTVAEVLPHPGKLFRAE